MRVAVVTGGSRGIGRAFVVEAAQRGYAVVFSYHSRHEDAEQTLSAASAHGPSIKAVQGDLTEQATRERLIGAARDCGDISLLINNAGLTLSGPLESLDLSTWNYGLALNLTAPMALSQALATDLTTHRGAVVNVSSTGGLIGSVHSLVYGASKAGLIGLTKTLARMLAPHVRVNSLCPGPIDTELLAGVTDAQMAEILDGTPLKRLGQPEEIARAGMDLSEWKYCTGQTIVVDGGRVMV